MYFSFEAEKGGRISVFPLAARGDRCLFSYCWGDLFYPGAPSHGEDPWQCNDPKVDENMRCSGFPVHEACCISSATPAKKTWETLRRCRLPKPSHPSLSLQPEWVAVLFSSARGSGFRVAGGHLAGR